MDSGAKRAPLHSDETPPEQLVAPDELVVAYHLAEEEVTVFTVWRNEVSATKLPNGKAWLEEIESRADAPWTIPVSLTWEDFLPEVAHAILPQARRVVVMPDGVLWRVTFAGLGWKEEDRLEAPVIHAMSLSLSDELRRASASKAEGTALIVGVGNFKTHRSDQTLAELLERFPAETIPLDALMEAAAADAELSLVLEEVRAATEEGREASISPFAAARLGMTASSPAAPELEEAPPPAPESEEREVARFRSGGGEPMKDLRYSVGEAQQIAALYPESQRRLLIEEDADRDTILRELRTARIAHFATHAVYQPDNPFASSIFVFGGLGTALTAADILDAHTNAIIVLSCCETAEGPQIGGEALVGLTYAFLRAGARAVVSTLWDLDDASGAKLGVEIHRQLIAGSTIAEAVHIAQETALRNGARLRFAVPFIVIGDPDAKL